MSKFALQTVLALWVWFMLTGVCLGKQLYLQGGGMVECKSFRQVGNMVIVRINRDTEVEFKREEIDLGRTLLHAGKKPLHRGHRKPGGTVMLSGVAKTAGETVASPVTAKPPKTSSTPSVKPVPAQVPAPAPKPVPAQNVAPAPKPVPPRNAAPAPKPVPAPIVATAEMPAPAPAAKEPAQPEPAAKAPSETAAPPDKAEIEQRSKQAAEMMAEAIKNNDRELMKKAIELQQSTVTQESKQQARIWSLKLVLIVLICSLLILVSTWVVFAKAGESGWKSLIPVYNMYILMVISGKPGWWFILLFIPLVGAVFYLLAMLALAERFGRSALFGVGLCFLPMFFFPLLAFGGSQAEV